MVRDQLPMIIGRVISCGPFLYLGLLMLIDPAKVERFSRMIDHHIQNFEQALRGFPMRGRYEEPRQAQVSQTSRIGLRCIGLFFIAWSFLYLITAN